MNSSPIICEYLADVLYLSFLEKVYQGIETSVVMDFAWQMFVHGMYKQKPVHCFLYLNWFGIGVNWTDRNTFVSEIHHSLTNSAEVLVILSFGHNVLLNKTNVVKKLW